MATLRNKRKLSAVARETQEKHPRSSQSRNMSVPRIKECITEVSEKIESRVTKKLSQEFSTTESHILGALSKLDEFLLNPQIRKHSATVPGTFRNTNVENQEPNGDRSQDDPHPEVGPSVYQSRHSVDSDPDEAFHRVNLVRARPETHPNGQAHTELKVDLVGLSKWLDANRVEHVACKSDETIVMSVWLPVKMPPWDRQFTYLVLDVASSLIIYICYT